MFFNFKREVKILSIDYLTDTQFKKFCSLVNIVYMYVKFSLKSVN